MDKKTKLLFAGIILLSGCSLFSPTNFISPDYDFSLIKAVAVMPFENLSQDSNAGERIRKIVVTEVLTTGAVSVIEIGQVNKVLSEQKIESISKLNKEDYKNIGHSLQVQALITGTVMNFDKVSESGITVPEVTISLTAIDVESGNIIWSTNGTTGGVGIIGKLFGIGGESLSEASQRIVRKLVRTLF